uniref:MARVEL domain-containing protein n=1 Tax=Steinernema glaseri TaxID=37863 RepID=A0A1I7ZTE4_9BILA
MGRRCNAIPCWSVLATIATVGGTLMFCTLIDKGVHGFLYQLGAFSKTASDISIHWEITAIGILTTFFALLFLIIGMRSTFVTEAEPKFDDRCSAVDGCVHPAMMYLATLLVYGAVMVWIALLCCAVSIAVLYAVFMFVMTAFCATVDNKCFDLSVLLPAIVSYASNNKVDLTFCKDKKDAICLRENNQIWVFIGTILCGIVALVGLIHFLMCFSANLARIRLMRRARRGEHIAMNQGTVDSNSFIMTNMDK